VDTEFGLALPSDLPLLVELLGILFAQERELSPYAGKQLRALEMILADPAHARIYVARQHGTAIGMAALHFTTSTAEGGRVAGLEDCVVHPEQRGKGIGEKLLSYVLEQAKAEGALRVMLLTDGDNMRAQALYRKLGFAPSSMLAMRLKFKS